MKKRYVLIIIFLLSIFITNTYASTNTYDRNTLDNYGVNKKWKINDKNKSDVLNTTAVNADEKVYDFSDILTDEEEKELYNLIDEFRDDTDMDLVFLSQDFYYSYDSKNEEYAVNFYDYNDFGLDIEHYSGVILFLNSYESAPYFGIYTFGEAMLYYSDDITYDIRSNAYNELHERHYYDGLVKIINSLKKYYKKGYAPEYKYSYIDENGYIKEKYHAPFGLALIISIIGTAISMSILIGKNKMIRKEHKANEYLNKDSVTYSRKEDRFITSHTKSYTSSSSSGGSSSGGRSGSSGGGHGGSGGRI